MTNRAARKQARRFWGTMGATLRRTAQYLDSRRMARSATALRPAHGFLTLKADARHWRGS